jgi:hypothetical protein
VASRASLAQLLWLCTQQFKAAHMHRRIALEVSFLPGAMRGKVRKHVVCPWLRVAWMARRPDPAAYTWVQVYIYS